MSHDSQQIAQILQGDREAFRELVETYQDAVVRVCQSIMRDHGRAEDIAQETFVTAYRKLDKFDSVKGTFAAWLFTIARRLCINASKKSVAIPIAEPPDGASSPDDAPDIHAGRNEAFQALDNALATLSEEHRRAFVFAEIEELPYSEIAQIEQIAVGTVKSRVSRAKNALQGLLRTTFQELKGNGP